MGSFESRAEVGFSSKRGRNGGSQCRRYAGPEKVEKNQTLDDQSSRGAKSRRERRSRVG